MRPSVYGSVASETQIQFGGGSWSVTQAVVFTGQFCPNNSRIIQERQRVPLQSTPVLWFFILTNCPVTC